MRSPSIDLLRLWDLASCVDHCSVAQPSYSPKPSTGRDQKTRGQPQPHDSLSPNDIHSEAKCVLHSVRLALQGTEMRPQHYPKGAPKRNHQLCGSLPRLLGSAARFPQLYLGQLDGFIELVQGALEVCNL